jgi:hypothetical protein
MAEYHNQRRSSVKAASRSEYGRIFKHINATGSTQEARRQVFNGEAMKTRGGLRKQDIIRNKQGKYVSLRKRVKALKENPLGKAGYGAKKGHFGTVRLSTMTAAERRKHMAAYSNAGKFYKSRSASRSRSRSRMSGGVPGDPPTREEGKGTSLSAEGVSGLGDIYTSRSVDPVGGPVSPVVDEDSREEGAGVGEGVGAGVDAGVDEEDSDTEDSGDQFGGRRRRRRSSKRSGSKRSGSKRSGSKRSGSNRRGWW